MLLFPQHKKTKKSMSFLFVKSLQHFKPRQWSAQISEHLYTFPALWLREIWPLSTRSVILVLSYTHLYYFTLSTPPCMGPSHTPLSPPASHEPLPPADPSTITVICNRCWCLQMSPSSPRESMARGHSIRQVNWTLDGGSGPEN